MAYRESLFLLHRAALWERFLPGAGICVEVSIELFGNLLEQGFQCLMLDQHFERATSWRRIVGSIIEGGGSVTQPGLPRSSLISRFFRERFKPPVSTRMESRGDKGPGLRRE